MVTIDCLPQILVVSDNRKDLISNAAILYAKSAAVLTNERVRLLGTREYGTLKSTLYCDYEFIQCQ